MNQFLATRKAEADAANEARGRRRLVSLGETEFTQRNLRTGEIDVLPATLYYDRDHPVKRFYEIAGVPGRHAFNTSNAREEVTKLAPLKNGRPRGPSPFTEPAVAEPPPRSV